MCVLISVRKPTHTSAFHTDTVDHLSWLAFWVARIVRRVSPQMADTQKKLVGIPTPLKNDGVRTSWDYDIANWMEK